MSFCPREGREDEDPEGRYGDRYGGFCPREGREDEALEKNDKGEWKEVGFCPREGREDEGNWNRTPEQFAGMFLSPRGA